MFKATNNQVNKYGELFIPDTEVSFQINGEIESGTILKQLVNSAIVEINETESNQDLIFQTHGNIVISYKDLKRNKKTESINT